MTADLAGLHPAVRAKWAALLTDSVAQQHNLYIVSAYRSPTLQAQLFAEAVKKYGSELAARKWVAPPWHSNHGPVLKDDGTRVPYGENQGGKWGAAVDLGAPNVQAVSGVWPTVFRADIDALAKRYGFASPMDWEDWHYEPVPGFDYSATHVPSIEEDDVTVDEMVSALGLKNLDGSHQSLRDVVKAVIEDELKTGGSLKAAFDNVNTHIGWVGPDGYKKP